VSSGFLAWLDERRAKGKFTDFDPDAAFASVAAGAGR
jgi:hypothetical protein